MANEKDSLINNPLNAGNKVDIIDELKKNAGYNPFKEIIIEAQEPIRNNDEVLVEESEDNIRQKIFEMRQLAKREGRIQGESQTFYLQGIFMQDFEDDYCHYQQFNSYFPYYQIMSYAQLRTYFSWRSKVRKGLIEVIDTSYAFLYVYELLNNIGVVSPQDGLDKLMDFWRKFDCSSLLNRYLARWIKDYHVIYQLNLSFIEFVKENELQKYYPDLLIKEGEEGRFAYYMNVAEFNEQKAACHEENRTLWMRIFLVIYDEFGTLFAKNKMNLTDLLFQYNALVWRPFVSALYDKKLEQQNRIVEITPSDIYMYHNNYWTEKHYVATRNAKQFFNYLLLKTSRELAILLKMKNTDSVPITSCPLIIRQKVSEFCEPIDKLITKLVAKYYRKFTAPTFVFDPSALTQIKKEAEEILEKLIVPEDIPEITPILVQPQEPIIPVTKGDVFEQLIEILTEQEKEAIKIIHQKGNLKEYALQQKIMVEVLVDNINQKALELICDNIIEINDEITIYEEYQERIKV